MSGELIGYARVSTAGQDVAGQVEALTAVGCGRVFAETVSGASAARPQFEAMLDYVRPSDTVVVVRLDRLGRSTLNTVRTMERLRGMNVTIRSLAEGIDTSSSHGRMVFAMLASIAELERESIAERTRAGLAYASTQGRHGGRPSVLGVEKAQAARRLRGQGWSLGAIAKALGVSKSTIYRVVGASARVGQSDQNRAENRALADAGIQP